MSATVAVVVKGALTAVQLSQVVLDLTNTTQQFLRLAMIARDEKRSISDDEIKEFQRKDDEAREAQVKAVAARAKRER